MRFTFGEERLAMRAAVRDLLEKECAPEHVREAARSPTGRSPERWRRLAEMGVVGLTAPREHGGLGLDEVDLVLVLEEAGRAALPEALLEHTAVAIPLVRETAPAPFRDEWLPRLASGEVIATVGFGKSRVADAHQAGLLLLQAGEEIHVLTPAQVAAAPVPSVDGTRRLFTLEWRPAPETLLARDPAAIARALDRGALAAAAELAGVAQRAIEMAASYARERHQFGRPIGSFQAVKHLLADALVGLELARPAVYRAAHSVARSYPDRARDVSMAKALASEAATAACRAALQVHGAIGYTQEADLHLWMKRAWALAEAWGGAAHHRARVAAAVLA